MCSSSSGVFCLSINQVFLTYGFLQYFLVLLYVLIGVLYPIGVHYISLVFHSVYLKLPKSYTRQ